MLLQEQYQLPAPRTYHAACLVDKYMVICGGEANADMQDMWTLDLELGIWCQLELHGVETFKPKRFHSASAVSKNRVITFGGCFAEYQHLNDVNIFDLDQFVKNGGPTTCVRLTQPTMPDTRWGHSAAVFEDRLYILGGRNEQDISDLHCFSVEENRWSEIKLLQPVPKPRRRHSSIFVSSSLIMFGGFDGEFYNDLHILHLKQAEKT